MKQLIEAVRQINEAQKEAVAIDDDQVTKLIKILNTNLDKTFLIDINQFGLEYQGEILRFLFISEGSPIGEYHVDVYDKNKKFVETLIINTKEDVVRFKPVFTKIKNTLWNKRNTSKVIKKLGDVK